MNRTPEGLAPSVTWADCCQSKPCLVVRPEGGGDGQDAWPSISFTDRRVCH